MTERRHTIGAAFYDRGVNIFRFVTVNPKFVHKRWANATAAIKVTTRTVVLSEETLAFIHFIRSILCGVVQRWSRWWRARLNVTKRQLIGFEGGRRLLKRTLFTFAGH